MDDNVKNYKKTNIDYTESFSEKDKEFLERLEKGEKPKDTDFIP